MITETMTNDASHGVSLLAEMDEAACLNQLTVTVLAQRTAERDRLRLATRWCVLHSVTDPAEAAHWGDNLDASLGGEGAPLVSYRAAESWAATAGVSTMVGQSELACALDLTRMPILAARVERLEIPVWRAERIVTATHRLNPEAAAFVDQQLAARSLTCGTMLIDRVVAEAAARFDPVAQAEREAKAAARAEVTIQHDTASTTLDGATGMSWFTAYATTPTVTKIHDLVSQIAEEQRLAGDESDLGIRKANALGIIVDRAIACGPHAPTAPGRDKTLYVHVTAADLITEDTPLGTVEKLGALTIAKIAEWFADGTFTIRPVLDLSNDTAVDQHDAPGWMRDIVTLRDRTCRFPWCPRDARSCDQDHIDPYVPPDKGGGRGQTSPTKLASLCRRHHNDKTHRGWKYRRLPDGSFLWTSPHHRRYRVDGDHTHAL